MSTMGGWRGESKGDSEGVREEDDGRKSRRIRMRYRLPGRDRGEPGSQILLLFQYVTPPLV